MFWVFVGCTIISTRIRSIGTRMWYWIWQNGTKTRPRLCRAAKQKSYAELEKVVPTSVFFHFPMEEYRLAWTEYVENDYKDTKNVKYRYGLPGESGKVVYCGIHPDQLFETMQELGSTDSTFCGHDHYNNFSLNYKGINLTYGYSIDYLAYVGIYKQGTQRGATILDYDKTVAWISTRELLSGQVPE